MFWCFYLELKASACASYRPDTLAYLFYTLGGLRACIRPCVSSITGRVVARRQAPTTAVTDTLLYPGPAV